MLNFLILTIVSSLSKRERGCGHYKPGLTDLSEYLSPYLSRASPEERGERSVAAEASCSVPPLAGGGEERRGAGTAE